MPAYGVVGPSGSGVAPLTAVEVRQGATISTARIYEIICGLASAPSDNYLTWVVQKTTTAGTATSRTPEPLDVDDRAALVTGSITHTAEPTYGGTPFLEISMHFRTTFRWVARHGGEILVKRAATNGVGVKKTVQGTTGAILDTTIHWFE